MFIVDSLSLAHRLLLLRYRILIYNCCFSNCKVAIAKQEASSEIVEEVAVDLERLSESHNSYGGDLASLANVMEDIVEQVDVQVARNVSTTPRLVNKVQKVGKVPV